MTPTVAWPDESVITTYRTEAATQETAAADTEPVPSRQFPPSTVGRALQEASIHLRTVSETPRVEAEILLMHVLDASRSQLLTHPDKSLSSDQLARFEALVGERGAGYPLPHLTGRIEFYGLEIEVTAEVLIPRPETETLVDLALARCPRSVVDVGTGSGCIAVALAKERPDLEVYAIDISPAALAVAQRNAERHGVDDRVQFIVSNLLDRRPSPVDLIVSNPPYVSADEWAALPPTIRHYEPRLALEGGSDGLDLIRRLLSQSQGLLEPGGALLIEIGANQAEKVREIAKTVFPQQGTVVRIHPDLAGRDRVLEVQV